MYTDLDAVLCDGFPCITTPSVAAVMVLSIVVVSEVLFFCIVRMLLFIPRAKVRNYRHFVMPIVHQDYSRMRIILALGK